jgi:nicotinamide-nucleotide amidase
VSARAGIIVTGTEVLSGIIRDSNGPWLSERLREQGIDCAQILIVGDRREDMRAALESQAALGLDLIVTSGGLGPTADDLTADVVAEFTGRSMGLDAGLEERIWGILERLLARWQGAELDQDALRASNRKQAIVPEGATILEPVGTAPGLVVPPVSEDGPTILVLPGPPRELQPMWETALTTPAIQAAISGAGVLERGMLRLWGIPESEIVATLLALEADGVRMHDLEITTCLRRGEIEIATVYDPSAAEQYTAFADGIRARHAQQIFSDDGSTIDDQVAELLAGRTVATAESCTGGLLAARLTDRPGSSAYVLGGLVVYSNEAKVSQAGVPAELIAEHGAVSPEVAAALADGARGALGASVGVGITGIAGPDGGTEEKPVGLVCMSVSIDSGERWDQSIVLPGNRVDIRDRSTTMAMHGLRRLLLPLS